MRYAVFVIFCGLFLLSSGISAQKPLTVQNSALKIDFPEVKGWKKSEIYKYPTAALGYSVGYESETSGWIDIYVYDNGNESIPDGLDTGIVKAQFKQAQNDIMEAQKQGMYKDVRQLKTDTVTLGGTDGKIKVLYALYDLTNSGHKLTSELYLFVYKNNFIKLRSSRPKKSAGETDPNVAAFLAEMDNLFSKNDSLTKKDAQFR